jgi:hypothetical protein
MDFPGTREFWSRKPTLSGIFSLLAGLVLNYFAAGHSFGIRLDILFASIAFFLALTGFILLIVVLRRSPAEKGVFHCLLMTLAISVPFTGLYVAFYFGMQFIQTGADRYGECPGLVDAAAATHDLPTSQILPPAVAAYCGNGRSGMFLWPYNSSAVYGVTGAAAQDRIVKSVSRYHAAAHTLPVNLMFYDKEDWIQHKGQQGPGWGGRGPESLIRTVNLR